MDSNEIISLTLGLVILVSMAGLMGTRIKAGRGITWSVIRFSTVAIALPLAGILALNKSLDQASTAIIAGALGYAFGKPNEGEKSNTKGSP